MSNLYRSLSAGRKRHVKNAVVALALGSAVVAVQWVDPKPAPQPKSAVERFLAEKGLKDYYKDYFSIGVAVNARNIAGGEETELIKKEFNSLTPENDMKMGPIHPSENEYNWTNADAIVDFAVKNGIKIRGHNLLWHSQAAPWMFKGPDGNTVSKELLLKRLKDHITTVVNRYKGKIYAWDVVNEAIDDRDTVFMRNSQWYQICGDDFIPAAFEYAHAADPNAELYYNDYNESTPSKRDKIYKLVKSLLDKKVPIHGIGLQGHWRPETPTIKEIRDAFAKYASLGLKLQVTELDITVRTQPKPGQAPDTASYNAEMADKQAKRYKEVFEVFRDYKKQLNNVTFWNVSDRQSWRDGRDGGLAGGAQATQGGAPGPRPQGAPGQAPAGPPAGAPGQVAGAPRPQGAPGQGFGGPGGPGGGQRRAVIKAYPLLFGVNLERKKAYDAVVNF